MGYKPSYHDSHLRQSGYPYKKRTESRKITRHDIKISMIIVDNKGNYDIDKLIESANLKNRKNWDIYFYKRKKASILENDGAYNHSKAIHEIFNVMQNGRLLTKYPNINPIVMLMDPDLFIIEKTTMSSSQKS